MTAVRNSALPSEKRLRRARPRSDRWVHAHADRGRFGRLAASKSMRPKKPQPCVLSSRLALVPIVVIYGIGHVMANLSGHFYEGIIVRRWLKMPSTISLQRTNRLAYGRESSPVICGGFPGE